MTKREFQLNEYIAEAREQQPTPTPDGPGCVDESDVTEPAESSIVNHPPHYLNHPSGIECIQVTEHMNFCLGNAVKYIWRAGLKGDALEDLRKAAWYINREILQREGTTSNANQPAQ